MTQEGAVPPDLWELIEQKIDRKIAEYARSGSSRNMSLSAGGRFTIKGGALVVTAGDGSTSAYFGGIYPAMPDGNLQPGMILRREDGSIAAALYDPTPDPASPDGFKQFFAIYDRAGNIVFSDDTASGQGHARPGLSGGFAAAQFANFRYSTTSASFVTLAEQWVRKQQPRLQVAVKASMDTAATTGELRVLVDDVQLGATAAQSFAIATNYFGPAAIAGYHRDSVMVKIQGCVTSGSGALKVEPMFWEGYQS